jgi:hypothetical protein
MYPYLGEYFSQRIAWQPLLLQGMIPMLVLQDLYAVMKGLNLNKIATRTSELKPVFFPQTLKEESADGWTLVRSNDEPAVTT